MYSAAGLLGHGVTGRTPGNGAGIARRRRAWGMWFAPGDALRSMSLNFSLATILPLL